MVWTYINTIDLWEWHRSAPLQTQLHTVIKQFPVSVLHYYHLSMRTTPFRSVPHQETHRNQTIYVPVLHCYYSSMTMTMLQPVPHPVTHCNQVIYGSSITVQWDWHRSDPIRTRRNQTISGSGITIKLFIYENDTVPLHYKPSCTP